MEKFETLKGVVLPLDKVNIDTDQILPARYLQKPRANNFGDYLFKDVRHDGNGLLRPEFVLNQAAYVGAQIMLANDNFGCGSSREHAVWAIYDGGFRAVIAPSFGDIFFNNALKNGLLPIRLAKSEVMSLFSLAQQNPVTQVVIDLVAQTVVASPDFCVCFEIDNFSKRFFLEGIDELGYTLSLLPQIEAFERKQLS
jgi:3-isopropylmalate/(R)-2-methylmalate dehydratase small subunit